MSTPPATDIHADPLGTQTERVLREFVRDAVSRLVEVLDDSVPEFDDDIRFERGADGHFRERKKRIRRFWPMLNDESVRALPGYGRASSA